MRYRRRTAGPHCNTFFFTSNEQRRGTQSIVLDVGSLNLFLPSRFIGCFRGGANRCDCRCVSPHFSTPDFSPVHTRAAESFILLFSWVLYASRIARSLESVRPQGTVNFNFLQHRGAQLTKLVLKGEACNFGIRGGDGDVRSCALWLG